MAKRISVTIEAAFALFLVCAGVAALLLLKQHPKPISLLLAISFPALASIGTVAVASFLRDISPAPRLSFPMNLTLPFIHVALLSAVVQLVVTRTNPLEALPPRLAVAEMWQQVPILLVCLLLQIAVLSAVVMFLNRKTVTR